MKYSHLLSTIFNKPLLVDPGYAELFCGGLGSRIGINSLTNANGITLSAEDLRLKTLDYDGRRESFWRITDSGIAVIPVTGSLASRGGVNPMSGLTSYSAIREWLKTAEADPKVRGIFLDVDSPGGVGSNLHDTAQLIAEINQTKPVWSMAYDQMTSAAYYLSCSSSRIITTSTANVGSIGVMMMHRDLSKQMENDGINITMLTAGNRKTEGNPFEPLPQDVRERAEASLSRMYEQFAGFVADHRPMSIEEVKGTEAGVFEASEAKELGLVDDIMSADTALDAFAQHLSEAGKPHFQTERKQMALADELKKTASEPGGLQQALSALPSDDLSALTDALKPASASAAFVLDACESAELQTLASTLVKRGDTEQAVTSQLEAASQLKDVLSAAGMDSTSESVIKTAAAANCLNEGMVSVVKLAIVDAKASADQDIDGSLGDTGLTPKKTINPARVYQQING